MKYKQQQQQQQKKQSIKAPLILVMYVNHPLSTNYKITDLLIYRSV